MVENVQDFPEQLGVQEMQKQLAELKEEKQKLEKSSDGGDNGGMDAWQQTVEVRLSELRIDIREIGNKIDKNTTWLAVGIGTAFIVGLGALYALGFNLDEKYTNQDRRLDGIEKVLVRIDERLSIPSAPSQPSLPPQIAPQE